MKHITDFLTRTGKSSLDPVTFADLLTIANTPDEPAAAEPTPVVEPAASVKEPEPELDPMQIPPPLGVDNSRRSPGDSINA